MCKRGKVINPKSFSRNRGVASDDMDDEIDAFRKQRDIILPDANGDIVDSDDEIPVLDLKDMNDDEDEDDETGDSAKILRALESRVLTGQYLSLDQEWFPHSPWLENGVLRGQYPSLDPDILNLKSGKEHQWIDYQWKDFEDLFHQKYKGPKFMVEFFCNRQEDSHQQASTAEFISSYALERGALRGEYPFLDSEILKKIEGALLGQYQILDSKNFGGALQGGRAGPLKEAKGLTKKKNYRGAKGGSECQDAEPEGSRSGTSQDLDGGVGSSSDESQSPDRGDGNAPGENQGGDGNSGANGSGDGGDGNQRGHDIEHGTQENNQEEIDFLGINQTIMAIIGTTTVAAVDFHNNRFISTTILGLLIAINVFGFLCCMTSMLHRHRSPRTALNFGIIGAVAASFGFLLLVSGPFSGYYYWMLLILGSLGILVIFVLAFMS